MVKLSILIVLLFPIVGNTQNSTTAVISDDFIQISIVPTFWADPRDGTLVIKKDFGGGSLPNSELVSIYNELDYLIQNKPELILIPDHVTSYEIESSHLGKRIKLLIYEDASSDNSEAEAWINRSEKLYFRIITLIKNQMTPNKDKNSLSLRSLGRANARPF